MGGGEGRRCTPLTSRYADVAERWIATFGCSRSELMLCLSAHVRSCLMLNCSYVLGPSTRLESLCCFSSTQEKGGEKDRHFILIRHLGPAPAPAPACACAPAPAPDDVDEFPLPLASAVPRRLQRPRTARTGSMSWQEATIPGEES
eukprot:scaffold4711_cov153-Pinguiococcus_pyrenoidosus.AAC.2